VIDEKHVIDHSKLVLPSTIYVNDLKLEQWRVFYELIKTEEEDTIFTFEALSNFPTHTKEEID
jgi:hypothetical protein